MAETPASSCRADVQAAAEKSERTRSGAHFGAGNIFRIFVGGHRRSALTPKGEMDRGITCVGDLRFRRGGSDLRASMTTSCWPSRSTRMSDRQARARHLSAGERPSKAQSGVPGMEPPQGGLRRSEPANGFLHHHGERATRSKTPPGPFFPFVRRISTTARTRRPARWRLSALMLLHRALKTARRR